MKTKLAVLFVILLATGGSLFAQDFIQNYSFVNTGTKGPGTTFANTGVSSFFVSWSPQTSMNTCSVQVDSSADGSSWGSGDLVASTSCTTAGSSAVSSLATGKFFVRVNVTVMSGNGGLNVTLKGWGGGGSGGGITQVPSLILPCTNNAVVATTTAPFGIYFCINGAWQLDSPAGGVIFAASYGAKGLLQVESTGANFTVTNGSNVVTCTTCKFTTSTFHPAVVGDILWATNWAGGDATYTTAVAVIGLASAVPITITQVTSDTQVTISANAGGNAGTTNGNNGALAWGPDDQTANHLAKVAAYDGLNCASIQLSGPFTNMDLPDFNTSACRGASGGSTASHYTGIFGQNPSGNTTILLPPWFGLGSLAGCNGATSGIACFGGSGGMFNVTFNGLGQSSFALGAHNLIENANDTSYNNVYCWGFAANSVNSTGLVLNTGIHIVQNVILDGCGATPIQVNGKVHPVYSLEALNGTSSAGTIVVSTGAYLSCFNCNVAPDASAGIGIVASGAGAIYEGYADSIFGLPYTGNCWAAIGGGTIHIHGGTCPNNGGAANATAITTTGSSFASIDNSTVAGGATSGAFNINSTSAFHYGTANTISANPLFTTPMTVTGTILGSGTAALDAGINTPERGAVTITEGAGAVSTGTFILTFNQTFTLTPAAAIPPSCSLTFANGTGSWNVRVNAIVTTAAATAMTWTIDNNAAALTNGSTYKVSWSCGAR